MIIDIFESKNGALSTIRFAHEPTLIRLTTTRNPWVLTCQIIPGRNDTQALRAVKSPVLGKEMHTDGHSYSVLLNMQAYGINQLLVGLAKRPVQTRCTVLGMTFQFFHGMHGLNMGLRPGLLVCRIRPEVKRPAAK